MNKYTVIRFMRVSAKFGTCTAVRVHGTIVDAKCAHSPLNLGILSSTSVPCTLTTVQLPNLALVETKRITVYSFTKISSDIFQNHSLNDKMHHLSFYRENTSWNFLQ
jgi:hypothetical protein